MLNIIKNFFLDKKIHKIFGIDYYNSSIQELITENVNLYRELSFNKNDKYEWILTFYESASKSQKERLLNDYIIKKLDVNLLKFLKLDLKDPELVSNIIVQLLSYLYFLESQNLFEKNKIQWFESYKYILSASVLPEKNPTNFIDLVPLFYKKDYKFFINILSRYLLFCYKLDNKFTHTQLFKDNLNSFLHINNYSEYKKVVFDYLKLIDKIFNQDLVLTNDDILNLLKQKDFHLIKECFTNFNVIHRKDNIHRYFKDFLAILTYSSKHGLKHNEPEINYLTDYFLQFDNYDYTDFAVVNELFRKNNIYLVSESINKKIKKKGLRFLLEEFQLLNNISRSHIKEYDLYIPSNLLAIIQELKTQDELFIKYFGFTSKALKKVLLKKLIDHTNKRIDYSIFYLGMLFRNLKLDPNKAITLINEYENYNSLLSWKNYHASELDFYKINLLQKYYNDNRIIKLIKSINGNELFFITDIINMLDIVEHHYSNIKEEIKLPKKPKTFMDIHNYLMIVAKKIEQRNFFLNQKALKILEKQEFDDYIIKVPQKNHELITIGEKLNICVGNGSYAKAIIEKRSFIITIYKKKDLKYCIEYTPDFHIRQARAFSNEAVPNEVVNWLKSLNYNKLISINRL